MICDLAETYHILNYKELSPSIVATLVLGLHDNSRVKKHISNTKLSVEQMMMAMIVDAVNFIAWTKTREAQKGSRYKKKSILKTLQGEYDIKKDELEVFSSVEEYERYMKQFIK